MKIMSLEEAGFFFNNTDSKIESFYYKFTINGKIKVQKKTFFRKVCRFFLLTFGYHRKALTEVVEKIVDFSKKNGIARSLSFIEFIGNKNIIPIDLSIDEDDELKITKKNKKILVKLDCIYNSLLEDKKSIMDLYFRLSRLQIKFFKIRAAIISDFELKNQIRQIFKKNELLLGISETRILDQLVSIRVLSQTLLQKNDPVSNSESNQKLHQFKSFKSTVLNFKHQLQDEVASQKEKNKQILNRLNLKNLVEAFTQKMKVWQGLSQELNDLGSKHKGTALDYSEYWKEMNSTFYSIYELFTQKYGNLPLKMSSEEINNCTYGIEKATNTLEELINRLVGCISFLRKNDGSGVE